MGLEYDFQAVAAGLSGHMLLSLEVAVEYWLALSWSPQAQWLSGSGASSALQHEVDTSHKPLRTASGYLDFWFCHLRIH